VYQEARVPEGVVKMIGSKTQNVIVGWWQWAMFWRLYKDRLDQIANINHPPTYWQA
jgi:hypothetical protein